MKMFIAALIIIILITGFSFFSASFLEKTALEMIDLLDGVDGPIKGDNWELAEIELKNFMKEWKKLNFMWAILIEHSDIDYIDIRLAYLQSYIETRSLVEACAEINALFKYLEQIPQTEKLTIQNIL